MCGITGFTGNSRTWKSDIVKMNHRIRHRGPDANEYWHDDEMGITMGHVRLAIVDLSENGRQPMSSHDDRYILSYNGEIYNFADLRNRLIKERKCTQFRGHSDTEVLLEYISAYGLKKTLDDIVGMYAFALFDREKSQISLVRDRMGEKPLYYGFINATFVFASDIGCIQELYKGDLTIDRDALSLYFMYGYIPSPYTIYKGIRKLEPGHVLCVSAPFDPNGIEDMCYWDIKKIALYGTDNPLTTPFEDVVAELNLLMHRSVKRQMMADVPVGAFLSGGIDSSAVVAIMQDMSMKKVKTFSIGFKEGDYDEAVYSRRIAEHLGTDHTELYLSSKDVIDIIPTIPYVYSEPFADSSQLPTVLVSKLAKSEVTVSLSGDGGDELFCGYNAYYREISLYNRLKTIPYPLRLGCKFIADRFPKTSSRLLRGISRCFDVQSVEEIHAKPGEALLAKEIVLNSTRPLFCYDEYDQDYLKNGPERNLMLMDMLMYLPDDILTKVDRASMSVSLESRIPLLDKELVEFSWRIPLSYNISDGVGKQVLRNMLFKYVPERLINRPKMGFAIPIDQWIRKSPLREWADEMLSPTRIKKEGILDDRIVSGLWQRFQKKRTSGTEIWYLLMFEQWLDYIQKG